MNTPMGGDDPPMPGTDYDPDNALMQSRAISDLQRQMRWITDLLGKYEEEVLVGGDGRKFLALADTMGTDPQIQRKWRLTGSIEAVEVVNPGRLKTGVVYDSSIDIDDLDKTFNLSRTGTRLYLEGVYDADGEEWKVTLKADADWSDKFPIKSSEGGEGGRIYTFTTFYYPIAVTHSSDDLENKNIEAVISGDGKGVLAVVPDSDLTLVDSYFIDNESNDGYYMVYPTPLPGDIYLPNTDDSDAAG